MKKGNGERQTDSNDNEEFWEWRRWIGNDTNSNGSGRGIVGITVYDFNLFLINHLVINFFN